MDLIERNAIFLPYIDAVARNKDLYHTVPAIKHPPCLWVPFIISFMGSRGRFPRAGTWGTASRSALKQIVFYYLIRPVI